MTEYEISITETLSRLVTIKAKNRQEAIDIVTKKWLDSDLGQEFRLNNDDFQDVDFQVESEYKPALG